MERRELACAVAFALVALVAGTLIARDLELPPEWNRVLDSSTGKYYYWNTASNEVQWHKPMATSIAELDDADDLLRGTGIEGFDYRILEAANGDVDDLFIGGAELQRELKFAGNNDTGTSAQPGDEDDKDNNVDEEKDRVDTQETPVAAARSKTERFFHGGSSWPLPGAAAAQVSAENNAAADDSCAQPHNKGTDSGASCRSGQQGVPPGPPVSPETHAHFARFDKNGDGGLDDAEFFAALRGTPLDPAELSHDDAEVVKGFLAEGSGRVSFTQWASLWEDDVDGDENEEDDVNGAEGGGLGKAERQKVGGGGSRFAEGDLVRIMGFDSSHEMSLYNGEIGDVVSWTAELVVVKTSVQKKIRMPIDQNMHLNQVLQVPMDKLQHARQPQKAAEAGEEEGGGGDMTQEMAEKKYFDAFDTDGDGQLSRAELRAMFAKRDGMHVADHAVEEMLAELDEDDNEHVDLREFWREIQGAKEMRLS